MKQRKLQRDSCFQACNMLNRVRTAHKKLSEYRNARARHKDCDAVVEQMAAAFVAGDECGQLKFVVDAPDRPQQKSQTSIYRCAPASGKQDRSYGVTSLQWLRPPPTSSDVCDGSFAVANRCVPTRCRQLLVGRANGLVEAIDLEEGFGLGADVPVAKRPKRIYLPSPVVLATPTVNNSVLAMCRDGECVVVQWDGLETDDSFAGDTCPSFQDWDFPSIPFGKSRRGRADRSDGAEPPRTQKSTQSPCGDGVVLTAIPSDAPPAWLVTHFRVPGPVGCASVSQVDRSKVAFAGPNNLLKILDVQSLSPILSAKNPPADMLDLEDPIDVRTVCFLDRLSGTGAVCATGNKNGRVHIYDHRLHGKPVLDVQVCPMGHAVVNVAASNPILYDLKHCACEEGSCMFETGCCLHWDMSHCGPKRMPSGDGCRQSLTITDNHGQVYLYDIRCRASSPAAQPSPGEDGDAERIPPPPAKRAKVYQPSAYRMYKQGQIVHPTPPDCGGIYEARWIHNLKSAAGGITGLQWSLGREGGSRVIGVGIDRHVHVWSPVNKKEAESVYLKNKLTQCLWVPGASKRVEADKDDDSEDDNEQTSAASDADDALGELSSAVDAMSGEGESLDENNNDSKSDSEDQSP